MGANASDEGGADVDVDLSNEGRADRHVAAVERSSAPTSVSARSSATETASIGKTEAAKANTAGVELLRQSKYEEAARQFKIALSFEPNSVQILNNIGLVHAKMQNFSGAYEWYEKAYLQDTSDVETLFSLAWVERKRQRYLHARELFQKVLDAQPEHVKALYLLGDILKTSHDYDGAMKCFERLIALDQKSVDGHISLAQCHEHSKEYQRAAQLYGHVLQLAPSRLDVVFFLGRVYYLAKQHKQAASCFDRIPDSDPRGFEARTYAAKACRELEDHDRAIANAERAAQFKPHPDVMQFLGEEYARKGDNQKAIHWFGRAIDKDPSHIASLMELGQIMSKQSRWAEAEAHFARVCELDRTSAASWRSLAMARFKQKKFDTCKQSCDAALRIDVLSSEALWLAAESHRSIPGSDERWFLSLRYPPDVSVADVCQTLAKTYLARNQMKEAHYWLQKVQHYLPSDTRVRDALRLIARQGAAVSPQDIADILDHRGPALAHPVAGALDGGDALGRRGLGTSSEGLRSVAAESSGVGRSAGAGRGESLPGLEPSDRAFAKPPATTTTMTTPETAEELERLLRRAERAAASRDGGGGVRQWQELLIASKAFLRTRSDDTTALRCVARALLATGGDSLEIRDYARRALRASEETGGGYTLGYELHMYLASVSERERDSLAAERNITAALNSKPGDEVGMLKLARVLTQRGDTTRARQLYEQVSASNPCCAEAVIKLAELSLEAGDNAEAYRHALRATKLSASDASALFALGHSCVRTGRTDEAISTFERALSQQPTDVAAILALAELQRDAGKDKEAMALYKRALDIRPGDYKCTLGLARLHASRGTAGASQAVHFFRSALQCPPPSTQEARGIYVQMADVHSSISDWAGAQQALESASIDSPGDVEVWNKLLAVFAQTRDIRGQLQCHRRLVQLNAMTTSKRVAYGEALLVDNQIAEAREQLEMVLREDANNAPALLKLALSWRQEGNMEEARKLYDQVLQTSPQNVEALEQSAYCNRKLNNVETAIQLYQSCLKVTPTAEGPLYYLGELLYRLGRHTECQHYLSRLVETHCSPDFKTGALYILAKSHVSLDDYAEAEKRARAGLELKPRHPHFLFILALVKNRMAEYDASINALEQALENCDAPDMGGGEQLKVEIHDWLAQAYERKKDYRAAISQLDIALQKDPQNVSALITKGQVHIQLKQPEQAEEYLKQALNGERNNALALVRLGYCRLLSNDVSDGVQHFRRALQQRCGTLALPQSVKGCARVYMALALMAQQDLSGALQHLAEARKCHGNFRDLCASAKAEIATGQCEGVIAKLRAIPDLDVNMAQAWQLVQLLAKELERDLQENGAPPPGEGHASAPAAAAPPQTAASSNGLGAHAAAPLAAGVQPPLRVGASAAAPSAEAPQRRAWEAVAAPPSAAESGGAPASASASAPSAAHQRRAWDAPAASKPPGSSTSALKLPSSARGGITLDLHEELDFSELTQGECLGTGGFGAVYRGLLNGKEVAIKKLFVEDGSEISPLMLEEIAKEVASLRSLNHPRLVAFIGACLQMPNLCIVTEFMPGGSLHHLLHKAKTPLTLGQQNKMALQVCEGVAFLHSLTPPVVHRDLKSMNIVLDLECNAKICDFGLTQSLGDKTHISLKDGGNGGSPRYMAPECYDTKGKITEKVDVWALGCIVIEIFGGPLPYDDCTNIQQIVAKMLMENQRPYIPHHLPRGVRPIVEECFHFDIKQRTSAQDAYARLRALRLAPG